MIYLLFILIALLSTLGVIYVGSLKGVVDTGKLNIYKPCEEEIVPFRGRSLIMLTMICVACFLAAQISLYKNTTLINFIKLFGLAFIVITAGVIDLKRKIIPNILIILGLIFRAAIYVYEILFSADDLKTIFTNDLLGFAIGFLFLAVVSLLSKGALGFGDAKLFGVIGLVSGAFCTYSTLLLSLVISAVVSLVNIARKKMGRKDTLPFGPCIAVGYLLVVFLTSY